MWFDDATEGTIIFFVAVLQRFYIKRDIFADFFLVACAVINIESDVRAVQ